MEIARHSFEGEEAAPATSKPMMSSAKQSVPMPKALQTFGSKLGQRQAMEMNENELWLGSGLRLSRPRHLNAILLVRPHLGCLG